MSSIEVKTIVDFVPSGLSQMTANWYAENQSDCPQWFKHGVTLMSNILVIGLTPLAFLCDLAASVIFKVMSFCGGTDYEQLQTKSWEYFKSAVMGAPLVVALAFIRMINPGYAADIQHQQSQPSSEAATVLQSPLRNARSRVPAPSPHRPASAERPLSQNPMHIPLVRDPITQQ